MWNPGQKDSIHIRQQWNQTTSVGQKQISTDPHAFLDQPSTMTNLDWIKFKRKKINKELKGYGILLKEHCDNITKIVALQKCYVYSCIQTTDAVDV